MCIRDRINVVCIGTQDARCLNRTRCFDVPFLTNTIGLEPDEELILEIDERRKKSPKRKTWHTVHKALADQEQKEERKSKKAKPENGL